ncbi:MAG: hypothetical protein AAB865_02235 [Patescibacteria group bacterium]
MQNTKLARTQLARTIMTSGLSFFLIAGVAGATTIDGTTLTFGAAGSISSTTSSALTLDSGSTGAVNLGTGAAAKTVTVGNNTTTSAVAITSGTGDITLTSTDDLVTTVTDDASYSATDDVTVAGGSTGSVVNIGTTAFAHVINVATNAIGNTINVATDNTVADTVNVGSALDTIAVSGVGITLTAAASDLNATSTDDMIFTITDDITLNGGSAGSIITLGGNVHGNVINVGTDNTAADTITVGSALDALTLASSAFNVSSAGAVSGVTTLSASGLLTGTAGATVSGAAISLNASSNFAVNVGTGTTTSAVNIGGTAAQTITIGAASATAGKTITIGSDNNFADTITVGSALDNTTIAGTVSIGGNNNTTSINGTLGVEDSTGTVVTNAVTINAVAGVITDDGTDINADATRADITLTNSRITANSVVMLTVCGGTIDANSRLTLSVIPTSGSAAISLRNAGTGNQTSTEKICFLVLN